jgi:hypothetical protein
MELCRWLPPGRQSYDNVVPSGSASPFTPLPPVQGPVGSPWSQAEAPARQELDTRRWELGQVNG